MRNCCLCCCTWVLTRGSAPMLARDLLADFNGLIGLARAGGPVLLAHPGVGPARYARLAASMELARRQALQEMRADGDVLNSPGLHAAIPSGTIWARARERYSPVLFMDSQHRVLRLRGPVFRHARRRGGVPAGSGRSGRCSTGRQRSYLPTTTPPVCQSPSAAADRRITERLVGALALLDISGAGHTSSWAAASPTLSRSRGCSKVWSAGRCRLPGHGCKNSFLALKLIRSGCSGIKARSVRSGTFRGSWMPPSISEIPACFGESENHG